MGEKLSVRNIEIIVKSLEPVFKDVLTRSEVIRNNEQSEMCKILFSHNIRYLRVYLGFIAKGSPYEQNKFAGLLKVSKAGLRRWENAEVCPNKAGLNNIIALTNKLLQLPTPATEAHILYRNMVTEIPLLRLGSHSHKFHKLPDEEKRRFSSFMTNNMDLMLSYFIEQDQQSRLNFQQLIERVDIPINLIKIGDYLPSFVNQAFCDLIGRPRKEIVDVPFLKYLHPDDHQMVLNFIEQLIRGEIIVPQFNIRILHSSGKILIIETKNREIIIDNEKYMLSTLRDITYSIEMEKKLKESEEKLHSTLASLDDFVFVIDRNGIMTEYYQPDRPDLYAPIEMFLNKQIDEVLPKDLSKKLQIAMSELFKTRQIQLIEYDMKIQDEIRRYSAKLSIRKSKLDEDKSVVVNARDITEKFKIEHALKESEEKYFQIFNTVLDGLAILNMDGIIIDVNPVIIKMYGYGNREEFIGKHASDFISPNYYYAFEQFVEKITESEEIYSQSFDIKKDGTNINIDIKGTSINLNGELHLLAIIRKITNKKI